MTQHSQFDIPLMSEVSEDLHPLLKLIVENTRTIVLGVIVLVVAAGAGAGVRAWLDSKKSDAREALGAAVLIDDAGKRVAALSELTAEDTATQALFELALAAETAEDWKTAADAWSRLAGNSDATVAFLGKLGMAGSLMRSGDAAAAYDSFAALKASAPVAYLPGLNRSLAAAAVAAGKTKEAVEAYKALLEIAGSNDKQFIEARIAEIEAEGSAS